MRAARVLNRMTEAEGRQAKVDNFRGYFRADDGKANYAAPAAPHAGIKIAAVTLPNSDPFDDADEDGDSVGVVLPWRFPQPFDNVTPAHMQRCAPWRARATIAPTRKAAIGSAMRLPRCSTSIPRTTAAHQGGAQGMARKWRAAKVERKDDERKMRTFVEPGAWSQS